MSEPVSLQNQNDVMGAEDMEQDFDIEVPEAEIAAQQSSNPEYGNFQPSNPESATSNDQPSQIPETPSELTPEEKLRQTEQAASALNELNSQASAALRANDPQGAEKAAAQAEIDSRSVYIGNVDYSTTPVELQQQFAVCGIVERVTIQTNKMTGQPKGFAYLEFETPEGAHKAVALQDGAEFKGRNLKVSLKRTNVPGFYRGNSRGRRGRGRGFMRGNGRGRGFGPRGGRFNPY